MDSSALGGINEGFGSWRPFESRNVREAPQVIGVYVLRKADGKLVCRLRGESDILYIGSTTSKGGLRQRLVQYFHPGPTQWTNQRINSFLKKYAMEVAWCPTSEPINLEHDLLRKYLSDHDELPPFNHADTRRLHKGLGESGTVCDRVTVIRTPGKE
jgi:hypothetical protein